MTGQQYVFIIIVINRYVSGWSPAIQQGQTLDFNLKSTINDVMIMRPSSALLNSEREEDILSMKKEQAATERRKLTG